MKRIYIAAPFTSLTNVVAGRAYGEIHDNKFISLLERIDSVLRECGFAVSLPHRDKGIWGKLYIDPEEIADICFSEVERCDWLLAIPMKSRAAHMEIAVAAELGKNLIIFLAENDDPSIFAYGLRKKAPTLISEYRDDDDLIQKVRDSVAIMEEYGADENYLRTISRRVTDKFLKQLDSTGLKGNHGGLPLAVVDFGSSSLKLTIARIVDGSISVIREDRFSGAPLADDVNSAGSLLATTIDRNVEVLRKWMATFPSYGVEDVKIVATGAARKARNPELLLEKIKQATGLQLQILDGDDEAFILYQGVIRDFPPRGLSFAVLNIGGSTTELIVGSSQLDHKIYHFDEIGVRSLRKNFLISDPPTDEEHGRLMDFLRETIQKSEFNWDLQNAVFLHTGGELDYVLSAGCGLVDSDLSPSHPKAARVSDFGAFTETIRKLRNDDLYKLAPDPKNPKWMEGAITCNAVALCMAKKLGVDRIFPSNRNLTHGILLNLRRESRETNLSSAAKRGV